MIGSRSRASLQRKVDPILGLVDADAETLKNARAGPALGASPATIWCAAVRTGRNIPARAMFRASNLELSTLPPAEHDPLDPLEPIGHRTLRDYAEHISLSQ